jgi:hypothetical protein
MKIEWSRICDVLTQIQRDWGKGNGARKRELALDILVEVIPLPFPASIPVLKRIVLGLLVDFGIFVFKSLGGDDWLDKLFTDKES